MSKKSYRIALALWAALTSHAANAVVLLVTDTGANTQLGLIQASLANANRALQQIVMSTGDIKSTTSKTLDLFTSSTPSAVPTINALDGGSTVEGASDTSEFFPQLAGAIATSATSTALVGAAKAAIFADQAKGLTSGDPLMQQAERQRQIGANIQAEAYNDQLVYAARLAAAKAIPAKLASANIKDAVVLSGGVQVEILRQLSLLGQSTSLNTIAVTQNWMSRLQNRFQHRQDHATAALLFK